MDWSEVANAALTLGLVVISGWALRQDDTPRRSRRMFAVLLPLAAVSFAFHVVAAVAPLPGR